MKGIWGVIAVVSASGIIAGCAVDKNYYAIDGSRADGTVALAYDYGSFEEPVVNRQQGRELAKNKCVRWGYVDAEPFGGYSQACISPSKLGCDRVQIIEKFQCLGDLGASTGMTRPAPLASAGPAYQAQAAQYSKDAQIQALSNQGLSYEEYSRRYKAIMAQ